MADMIYLAPNREVAERVASSGGTMAGPHSVRPACVQACEPARWVEEHEHETEVEYL